MSSSRESLLLDILAASETGFWSCHPTDGETFLSDRVYQLVGLKPGAFPMTMEALLLLVHPDDAAPFSSWWGHLASADHGSREGEFRFRTRAGGWKWLHAVGTVISADADQLGRRIVGTLADVTQKRLVEGALGESEARWTSLVDQAPFGITLLDHDGQVLFVNGYEAGFHSETMIGRNWKEFLPEELHPEAQWVLTRGFSGSEPIPFDTYRATSDGGVVRFENRVSPVRDGGVTRVLLVVSRDITIQYQALRRHRMTTQRMEVLLNLHSDPAATPARVDDCTVQASLDVTDSNYGGFFILAEDQQELALHSLVDRGGGRGMVQGVPQRVVPGQAGLVGQAFRGKRPVLANDVIGSSVLPLGSVQPQTVLRRFLAVPVLDRDRVVAVVCVANKLLPYDEDDVQELTTLTEGLWQFRRRLASDDSSRLLRRAIDKSPVGLVITNPEGRVEYYNACYHQMIGLAGPSQGELPQVILDPSGSGLRQDLLALLAQGDSWTGEWSHPGAVGKESVEWVTISPVQGPEGTLGHVIAVLEDVTERKATMDMLFRAQKMETIGTLAAGVAHDFNNLLTSVLASDEMLLLKMNADDPLRRYAEKIDKSGRRAADLVSGLLSIGRQQRLAKTTIDLGTLIDKERDLISSLVDHRISWCPPPLGAPSPVEVDPGQIAQVLINLVSNARDVLGPEDEPIQVSWGERFEGNARWAWFAVEDRGPGMPPHVADRIFDPFFTTKAEGKGTGLGLAVVQGIVHQHAGTIVLRTSPGEGSRFVISLPTALELLV